MAADRELLGLAPCPLCGNKQAKVKLSGTARLAYLTCNGCSVQIFARSATSDEKLRALIPSAAPAPKPAGEPKLEAKPAKPAPAKPAVAPARNDWDPYA